MEALGVSGFSYSCAVVDTLFPLENRVGYYPWIQQREPACIL